MKADIFRYCVCFDEGGYYLDISKTIDRRLSEMHSPRAEGLVTFERNACTVFPDVSAAEKLRYPFCHVAQWAFGFAPEHEVLGLAIERIVELGPRFSGVRFKSARQATFALTGPGLFTWAFREHLRTNPDSPISQTDYNFGMPGPIERIPDANELFESENKHYASRTDVVVLSA